MRMQNNLLRFLFITLCIVTIQKSQIAWAQPDLNFQRDRGRDILQVIKEDLKKNYYDSNFHGMDIEARFKAAGEEIKNAASGEQIFGSIAQALIDLNDSHTFFKPPRRVNRTEYGLKMQALGEKIFVSAIKPGSDAEKKGIKIGDQVLLVNGFKPSRKELWKLIYLFYTLRPQPGLRLVVQSPEGKQRQIDAMANIIQGKLLHDLYTQDINTLMRESEDESRRNRQRFEQMEDNLFIWKMPNFDFSESEADRIMGKAMKCSNLILDLRGNPGGYVSSLEWFAGYFFDEEIKIADLKGRKPMKPQIARYHKGRNFKGKLIVLVDSQSASAAEIFARIVQLKKRGTVIGDRTEGAVMESQSFEHKLGADYVIYIGDSITIADVIMADGKSLEGAGVTPDEVLLPAAEDMAAKRDPVLSHAAALAGVELTPEKAGSMFPVQWR